MIEQFFKFCVVGGSGVFVDFGVTYLCKEWLKLNKYVANSLGFLCASTSNYIPTASGRSRTKIPTSRASTFGSWASRLSGW